MIAFNLGQLSLLPNQDKCGEEKAWKINISSTGAAIYNVLTILNNTGEDINNGDKLGWVSNSQTVVTPQTPQAAECEREGVPILRKWVGGWQRESDQSGAFLEGLDQGSGLELESLKVEFAGKG